MADSNRALVRSRDQGRFMQRLCLALEWAAVEIFRRRWSDPALQALLPMTETEERWLRDAYGRHPRRPETLFSRMDVNRAALGPRWKEKARVTGCRLTSLNGAYECWAAGRILHERPSPRRRPEDDLLEMMIRRCVAHGRAIGIASPSVALLGVPPAMSRILNERGYRTVAAAAEEVRVRRGAWVARDARVDLIFRDRTLAELAAGEGVRAWKRAFRENRVVSSLAGEIGRPGLLEALPAVVPPWVRPYLSGRARPAGGVFATEFGVATLVRTGGALRGVLVSDDRA